MSVSGINAWMNLCSAKYLWPFLFYFKTGVNDVIGESVLNIKLNTHISHIKYKMIERVTRLLCEAAKIMPPSNMLIFG
jgi:hypothetical protein